MTENLVRPAGLRAARSCLDRRAALKLFAGGAALALASCGNLREEIVPYVEMPEGLTPGIPLKFATALLAIMFVLTFNDYASRPSSSPCDQPAFSDANVGQCESPVR